jgi:uncharacterized repeat protein (TIGR03803 family)
LPASGVDRHKNIVYKRFMRRRLMRGRSSTVVQSAVAAIVFTISLAALLLIGTVSVSAQTPKLVYGFTGGADGAAPTFLLPDSAGNLYGATRDGGNFTIDNTGFELDYGTVFKLAPNGNLTTLHTFSGPDGWYPQALALDSVGNLYGVTGVGGNIGCGTGNGCGVVFKIDPQGKFSILHTFQGSPDGSWPQSLVIDSAGNLYGTTEVGGLSGCASQYGCGGIFKIDTHNIFTVLYQLTGKADGSWPSSNLLIDSAGNLYFATSYDGAGSHGALDKLSPAGKLTVLYSFDSTHGCCNTQSLVSDLAGNFYGSTEYGGDQNYDGTIYKVTPSGSYSTVYTFSGTDGSQPTGPLAIDSSGNIYGTTPFGGSTLTNQGCSGLGCGVVYKVSPQGQETVLYNFQGLVDGYQPEGVTLDSAGHLYGTTWYGGAFAPAGPGYNYWNGTVFVLKP